MLHQLYKVSHITPFIVACSGGCDSMAIVDFYKRGNKDFKVAYFNHRTPQANVMQECVRAWCETNNVPLLTGIMPEGNRPSSVSPEAWWRDARYAWLLSFNLPVVTAHHLNDVAETWIFSAIHGNPKLIQPQNGLVYRPFLTNDKRSLKEWCIRHDVSWVEDTSNEDISCPRNRIRHNILPQCMEINPGILKVMRKKYPTSCGEIVCSST
jgi:tRNA(Ile)-lysidine synthase